MEWWQIAGLAILGAVAGASSGLLGIGGGVIMVPVLVVLFGFGQQMAQGTALGVMIPAALVGVFTYSGEQRVAWAAAAIMMLGAVMGARYGASLALAMPADALRVLFALLMVGMAVRMMPRGTAGEMGLLAMMLIIAAGLRLLLVR